MNLCKYRCNYVFTKTIKTIQLLTPSISITQIKYVLALEKTGSFSKAADMCFVTQSTLSTMIRKMEDQIDLKIFDRKSKPISLTQEGQMIIHRFKLISLEYENLIELIQDTKEEFHGTFKIGIIPTLAPFLLPLFLNEMVSKHPNINFSIDEITTNDIISRIKDREMDIGILSLPINDNELKEKELFLEDFLIYDANAPANSKKKYKIKDIDINRLWLLEESHCLSNQIENICHLRKKREMNSNLVYNSGSILSLIEFVNMNKGITLLPRLATLSKNIINNKFIYKMEDPPPVRKIGIIMHPNFSKKKLLTMIETEINNAVKPILKISKKVRVINPF